MIIITGSAVIQRDRIDEALQLGIEHSARSRGEPGCLAHNCHVDVENPQRVVFVEEWVDMAAVKTHFAVPESSAFVTALTTMAIEPVAMTIYSAEVLKKR